MRISIKPKEIVSVRYASSIQIQHGQITLNEGVVFQVLIFDEEESLISIESVSITGEEYSAWTDDDSYINGLILSKLQLELPE